MIDSRMFSMKRSVLAFLLLPAMIAAGREEPSSASRTATSTAEEIAPAIASQPAASESLRPITDLSSPHPPAIPQTP